MLSVIKFVAGLTITAGLVFSQDRPASGHSYYGQSWTGLLVSASCRQASGSMAKALNEAERTVNARTTTPAVDDSGTRGSSTADEAAAASRARPTPKDVPYLGEVTSARVQKVKDPGWGQARRQAASLDANCRVSSNTNQFALVLPDGTSLRFDNLANAAIAKQLATASPGGGSGIYRVQVAGKLQHVLIALDNIRF